MQYTYNWSDFFLACICVHFTFLELHKHPACNSNSLRLLATLKCAATRLWRFVFLYKQFRKFSNSVLHPTSYPFFGVFAFFRTLQQHTCNQNKNATYTFGQRERERERVQEKYKGAKSFPLHHGWQYCCQIDKSLDLFLYFCKYTSSWMYGMDEWIDREIDDDDDCSHKPTTTTDHAASWVKIHDTGNPFRLKFSQIRWRCKKRDCPHYLFSWKHMRLATTVWPLHYFCFFSPHYIFLL